MSDNLAQATCRLECATRALNTYLGLRTNATSDDPEYQRLWQSRVVAEQTYRTSLVALLASRGELPAATPASRDELPTGVTTESVGTAAP